MVPALNLGSVAMDYSDSLRTSGNCRIWGWEDRGQGRFYGGATVASGRSGLNVLEREVVSRVSENKLERSGSRARTAPGTWILR